VKATLYSPNVPGTVERESIPSTTGAITTDKSTFPST